MCKLIKIFVGKISYFEEEFANEEDGKVLGGLKKFLRVLKKLHEESVNREEDWKEVEAMRDALKVSVKTIFYVYIFLIIIVF